MIYKSVDSELGRDNPLFAAIMRRDENEISVLKARGEVFSEKLKTVLRKGDLVPVSDLRAVMLVSDFMGDLCRMTPAEFVDTIPRLYAEAGGKLCYSYSSVGFSGGVEHSDLYNCVSDPSAFECFLTYFRHRRQKEYTIKSLAEHGRTDLLAMCGEHGWFADPRLRAYTLGLAAKIDKPEIASFMLGYITSNIDTAAEREREERRRLREISAAPYSIAAMRRIWRWKKRPDGTLMITGWFGEEHEVVIPERIGRRAVTAVGPKAFSIYDEHLFGYQKRTRMSIASLTLPASLAEVADGAFFGCYDLKGITIFSQNCNRFGKALGSPNLISIVLGGEVKRVESGAIGLIRTGATVILREGVTEICGGAFENANWITLRLPRSVIRIDEEAFSTGTFLRIEVRKGSYAERFLKARKIKTVVLPDDIEDFYK